MLGIGRPFLATTILNTYWHHLHSSDGNVWNVLRRVYQEFVSIKLNEGGIAWEFHNNYKISILVFLNFQLLSYSDKVNFNPVFDKCWMYVLQGLHWHGPLWVVSISPLPLQESEVKENHNSAETGLYSCRWKTETKIKKTNTNTIKKNTNTNINTKGWSRTESRLSRNIPLFLQVIAHTSLLVLEVLGPGSLGS